MSQLARLIEFLDRDDVSEVVIATGRPVSVLAAGSYRPVSRAAVTRPQLDALVASTPVADMVECGVGADPNLRLFDRNVAVEVVPEGIEVCVRFSRAARPRGVSRVVRGREPAPGDAPTGEAPAVTPPALPPGPRPAPALSGPRSREPSRVVSPAFAALVVAARRRHATDLHVSAGQPAGARVLSAVHPVSQVIDEEAAEKMLLPLLDTAQRARLEERGYVDAALDVEGAGRLRANISRIKGGLKGSFRLPWAGPPTLEQLGLPRELARVTTYHQGLVVIAGPSGHGKTTTLAALVDLINASKPHHILTIEDPVEILHPRKKSVVSQREVGTHTRSFVTALKASLREDPDVIVIGELRDRETVEIALTAAETGHLVMATMSTPSAAKTLDRLIDMFPPDVQQQVRASLAAALKFVVAQRLLPTTGGDGVAAAVELLTGVLPLAAMIRDNKLYQVASLQQRGRAFGMIRLDDSLAELVRSGRVSEEVAMRHAESRRELAAALRPARRGGG